MTTTARKPHEFVRPVVREIRSERRVAADPPDAVPAQQRLAGTTRT